MTKLINYNSKITEDTKALLDALQKVQQKDGISSQRELIDDMLRFYAAGKPYVFDKAKAYTKLMKEGL